MGQSHTHVVYRTLDPGLVEIQPSHQEFIIIRKEEDVDMRLDAAISAAVSALGEFGIELLLNNSVKGNILYVVTSSKLFIFSTDVSDSRVINIISTTFFISQKTFILVG